MRVLALAAALMVTAFAGEAAAQTYGRAPPGSYQRECRDIRMYGVVLSADCPDNRGVMRNSSININQCNGDIANANGRLTCRQGGGGGGGGWHDDDVPRGSYLRTCRDAHMRRDTLVAECRDNRGRYVTALIQPDSCRGRDIANENGRLTCGRGGGGGGWEGRGRLIGHDYTSFRGGRQVFSDYEPNLAHSGMNDRIESIEISRGQRWQICSDANFRGRCVVITRNERDLRDLGLANQISSLRRLD